MKAIKNGISLKLQWILLFIPFINMLQNSVLRWWNNEYKNTLLSHIGFLIFTHNRFFALLLLNGLSIIIAINPLNNLLQKHIPMMNLKT